jgi:hypothetical protein
MWKDYTNGGFGGICGIIYVHFLSGLVIEIIVKVLISVALTMIGVIFSKWLNRKFPDK